MTEEIRKGEWPLNQLGLGLEGTLRGGPKTKDQLEYEGAKENYRYAYCGACVFFVNGDCPIVADKVSPFGSCKAYINVFEELSIRHTALLRQISNMEDDSEEVEKAETAATDIASDPAESIEMEVKFAGLDEERRLVYGIVLEPGEVDAHRHTIKKEEIEKAAHGYALTPMVVGDGHVKKAQAQPVETFIYDPELLKEVKPGSWVMAVKVHSDEMWEGVKSGAYTGFSIGALVKKRPVDEEEEDDK